MVSFLHTKLSLSANAPKNIKCLPKHFYSGQTKNNTNTTWSFDIQILKSREGFKPINNIFMSVDRLDDALTFNLLKSIHGHKSRFHIVNIWAFLQVFHCA